MSHEICVAMHFLLMNLESSSVEMASTNSLEIKRVEGHEPRGTSLENFQFAMDEGFKTLMDSGASDEDKKSWLDSMINLAQTPEQKEIVLKFLQRYRPGLSGHSSSIPLRAYIEVLEALNTDEATREIGFILANTSFQGYFPDNVDDALQRLVRNHPQAVAEALLLYQFTGDSIYWDHNAVAPDVATFFGMLRGSEISNSDYVAAVLAVMPPPEDRRFFTYFVKQTADVLKRGEEFLSSVKSLRSEDRLNVTPDRFRTSLRTLSLIAARDITEDQSWQICNATHILRDRRMEASLKPLRTP